MTFHRLGLLGQAGSGKDLVADWLVSKSLAKLAFADPMKRFSCGTFFLGYHQLWGPSEERNREFDVDEDWWFAAIGRMNLASYEIIHNVLPDGYRVKGFLALNDWFSALHHKYPKKISARVILQTLGTEWGRTIDPLMWARYAHETADRLKSSGRYNQADGYLGITQDDLPPFSDSKNKDAETGVVIPDHRFINEIDTTHENAGYVIRLRRLALEAKTVGIEGHKSESEQNGIPDEYFDLVLELEDFWKDDSRTEPDLDGLHRALEPVWQEKLWTLKRSGKTSKTPIVRIGGATHSS